MATDSATEIVDVYERKIWIESGLAGNRYVMIQHGVPDSEPFCYCTFHYNYGYTSNAEISQQAENMALSLGAHLPVELRTITLEDELRRLGFNNDASDAL